MQMGGSFWPLPRGVFDVDFKQSAIQEPAVDDADASSSRTARRTFGPHHVPREHHARLPAANLRTGKDASGHISLRSAIQAADARGGSNTIDLPAGTFDLTFLMEIPNASLAIMNNNLKIMGKGAGATIIDGGQAASVFAISNDNVSISRPDDRGWLGFRCWGWSDLELRGATSHSSQ